MCFQIYVIFSSSVIRPAKDPLWRVISSTRLTTCYPILAWFDMVFNIGNLIRGMWLDEKPPVRKLNLLFFLTAIAEGGPGRELHIDRMRDDGERTLSEPEPVTGP